jgi:UDP-N-acetylglucosamine 2-epimerase
MKILFVLGTRPEAIKLAPLILAARAASGVEALVCNTGQHREMSSAALALFDIQADMDLEIMRVRQTLGEITCGVLSALPMHLERIKPDWLIVQGDTTTTFAASLAAFYQKIPVAHIEAGLRTGNFFSPWPEEMNRHLVSKLAALHFPPTASTAANLIAEGINPSKVVITGNTGIDALKWLVKRLNEDRELQDQAREEQAAAGIPDYSIAGERSYVLITGHRRESFGSGFESICDAISKLATLFPDRDFIYPVHPNPAVRETVFARLRSPQAPNIFLVEPVGYLAFVDLMARAELILTDSGGVQEEAPSLGKRVIVMRESTERTEGLDTPYIRLAGSNREQIVTQARAALSGAWPQPAGGSDIYGDGEASRRILDALQAQ